MRRQLRDWLLNLDAGQRNRGLVAQRFRDFTSYHRRYDLARHRVRRTVGGSSLRVRMCLACELTQRV
jgi:hypothetical protein